MKSLDLRQLVVCGRGRGGGGGGRSCMYRGAWSHKGSPRGRGVVVVMVVVGGGATLSAGLNVGLYRPPFSRLGRRPNVGLAGGLM